MWTTSRRMFSEWLSFDLNPPLRMTPTSTDYEKAQHCRFVVTFCTLVICGLTAIAVFNGAVDPYGQYATGLVRPLVQDSRSEKTALFDSLPDPPSGLILGSSRALKIEPEYLQGKTGVRFFNFAVNHGRPEDFLAILRYYQHKHRCFPKAVVLGIDTAAMNDKVPSDARLSSEPRLFQQIQRDLRWCEEFDRYSQLFSLHQTKASVRSIVSLRKRQTSDVISTDRMVFRDDGVIVYQDRENAISEGSFDFEAALAYNEREFQSLYADFPTLSRTRMAYLEQLFSLCETNGCKLYVFRTVHHPELELKLAATKSYQGRQRESGEWLEQQSLKYHFKYCDFDQLHSFDGDPHLFVDGIHPLEANTRKMMEKLVRSVEDVAYAVQ